MGDFGARVQVKSATTYEYTRQEVTEKTKEWSTDLDMDNGLKVRTKLPKRNVTKYRESLEIQHAECGNVGNAEKYFASLEDVIKKYNISW